MSPPSGATYSIDPTLRREYQALTLRAVTGQPTDVTWMIDGHVLGIASAGSPVSWPLAVGSHEIEAKDSAGHTARASISVR